MALMRSSYVPKKQKQNKNKKIVYFFFLSFF